MHLDNYQRLHRNIQQTQGATLASLHVGHPDQRSQTHFHYPYVLLLHGYLKPALIHTQSKEVFFFLKKRSSDKILCTWEKSNFIRGLSGYSIRCCQVVSQAYSCKTTLLAHFFSSLFLFLFWTYCISTLLEYFKIIYLFVKYSRFPAYMASLVT